MSLDIPLGSTTVTLTEVKNKIQMEILLLQCIRKFLERYITEGGVHNVSNILEGNILQPLKISKVAKEGFNNYMKAQGKFGGQNKVPRLKNDRSLVEELQTI